MFKTLELTKGEALDERIRLRQVYDAYFAMNDGMRCFDHGPKLCALKTFLSLQLIISNTLFIQMNEECNTNFQSIKCLFTKRFQYI
jgi:hypothetical protein